ncbi:MAG: GGDEF domain-containing protein [Betaproteobacteria bacterium]|nr:GGDEF domain-containing protein [Betaproteobacteria bacterium]MBI2960816.1 GGDEF domain-containing protein [Betaproteobacteria bacterium]
MDKTTNTLIAIWLVIAAFIAFLIADLASLRRATEKHLRDQALSYARVVEQHASGALERVTLALIGVADHLGPNDLAAPLPETRRKEIEMLLQAQQSRTAGITSMAVTDADGTVVAQLVAAPMGTSLAERRHFQRLKQDAGTTIAISDAFKVGSGDKWEVMVGRAIRLPDGGFAGIVCANLGLADTFHAFYASLSLGERGTVSLRDADNRLLVRYPLAEEQLGRPIPVPVLAGHARAPDIEGVVTATSALDQVERLYGLRRLQAFPLFAVVGYSVEDALSGWRIERNTVAVAILLIVAAGAYITFAMRRVQAAEAALRTALEDQATHDLLTGLPNRRFAYAWLPYALSSAKRENKKLAVLFVDLDDFKDINDQLGHEAGDLVLKTVADRFMNTIRGSDVLVRHGGDEFLVLVQAADSAEELATLSARLIASLETRLHVDARDRQVGASIGIALYPDHAAEPEGLISAADAAMYEAKHHGGRHYRFAKDTQEPAGELSRIT